MMQISGFGLLNSSTALFASDSLDSVVFLIASINGHALHDRKEWEGIGKIE